MRRLLVIAGLIFCLHLETSSSVAAEPPYSQHNVIYITWDGFRWQEFFGGAQELYISKDAGVEDVEGIKQKFWRKDEQQRREALLPFVWTVMAKQGQIFGDPSRNAAAKIENKHKFSYPGYSEMFCGFPDDVRIASNNK